MTCVFENIIAVELPNALASAADGMNLAFRVVMHTDGEVPFAQVILWRGPIQLALFRALPSPCADLEPSAAVSTASTVSTAGSTNAASTKATAARTVDTGSTIASDASAENAASTTASAGASESKRYVVEVPAGTFGFGDICVQAEGCRRADIENARASDWIKAFVTIRLETPTATQATQVQASVSGLTSNGVRLYFGIHKHMHQPYYRTVEEDHWDGSIDSIFASRRGPYADYLVDAVERYIGGDLPHAGLSTSYSGSLIEQLERCDRAGLAGGSFSGWRKRLTDAGTWRTSLGHPRLQFAAFGHFHPLMPLIPARDIVRQIEWHRRIIRDLFGTEASTVLFPPETAFHVRMIPALVNAGVTAVIYDSIHRFRACKDYPYAGTSEGMLPPNHAEQVNPAVNDWLQLHGVWAGSLISPKLLRPAYVQYVDADDVEHRIVGIPAERYIGNEDARGGFGALQYPNVLGQLYDQIVATNSFDPRHPPFFLLHSDGDNHGGGADSYYRNNTDSLVEWLRLDPRFELTTIADYLDRFPVDPDDTIHLEPGSWSGADNGDPQFMKWFSRWDQSYSPDLNSWSVLTALQNLVHSAEDSSLVGIDACQRLLLMAETSCYWYWTGQDVWDAQVTLAANKVTAMLAAHRSDLIERDRLGPTIFPPWTAPSNPGGKAWGSGGLVDAPRQATLFTFIDDVCGVARAEVVLVSDSGRTRLPLRDLGPYPTQTGAQRSANFFSAALPVGLGLVRYFIEAADGRGNCSRSSMERVFLP